MSESFIYRIEARLKRLGHTVGWNLRGASLRHGSCLHCSQHVSLESQQGFHRATGDALERSCTLARADVVAPLHKRVLSVLA